MRRFYTLSILIVFAATGSRAQTDWQRVFTIPSSTLSSAYFFNANEGMIGTGNYLGGALATIYFTTDGGTRWTRAALPSASIVGEVTDIFFRDSASGWATLTEATPTGWSGIYHTTDRGRTWKLIHQAGFPVGIRETSRGIYYTDRDISPGVNLSTDGGRTWRNLFDLSSCLGIDFYDDDNGFATSQAYSSPPAHIATTDGGLTWQYVRTNAEAWTVLADPVAKSFLLSSEQNNGGTGSMSGLIAATSTSTTESYIHFDPPFGLTGGIAANRTNAGCSRYTYAQIRHVAGSLQPGFLRTTDRGTTWTQVSGPCNRADTRFAVTGRGAVIFAGDSVGGVWRTTNGGGMGLTPSVLPETRVLSLTASTRAALCDSATGVLFVTNLACDSISIATVAFTDDFKSELSLIRIAHDKTFIGHRDSIIFKYKPVAVRVWQAQLRLTLRQPDGYTEDTTTSVTLIGSQPSAGSIAFANAGSPATLAFDSVSLCGTEDRVLTVTNSSCYNLTLFTYSIAAPFRLRSQFAPFQLAPGESRSFIVEYAPSAPGPQSGYLIFTHEQGTDTLRLQGTGYSASSTFAFGAASIESSACDSATASVVLKNLTCARIRSLTIARGAHVDAALTEDTIAAGGSTSITLRLAGGAPGSGRDSIRIQYQDGSGLHDTTLLVAWRITSGTAALRVAAAWDFGTLSSCSTGVLDTIPITNTGCGDLSVTAAIDDPTQGFSLVAAPTTLAPGATGAIVLRYVPATSGGSATAHVVLHTNAGDSSITLTAASSNSAGALSLSQSSAPPTFPCEASTFSVSIHNGGCDSLYLVSEQLTLGSEFAIQQSLGAPLPRDESLSIAIVFTPNDSLLRNDVLVLHFRRQDGSTWDTSIALTGFGKSVSPVVLGIPRVQLSSQAGQGVEVPIYAITASSVPVRKADIQLAMNTDLLTAIRLVAGRGAWAGASLTTSVIDRRTLKVSLTLPTAQTIAPGELCALECRAQVTSELASDVRITQVLLDNGEPSAGCLPTVLALDSAAHFRLDALCGDLTISDFVAGHALSLDDITPSLTHAQIIVRMSNHSSVAEDIVLEIYNIAGDLQLTRSISVAARARYQEIPVTVTGSEGMRYVRVRTLSGALIGTRRVILLK